jgi:histidinol phosphatase-like PHP family hydrolase
MIDLHTHSLFSDGVLLPSELARRAEVTGYEACAITDHADVSNYDFIILRIIKACNAINAKKQIKVVPGIELTHVHPDDIGSLAKDARGIGAKIIIVHGETIAEPVAAGTNRKALEAAIDILAHPGLITDEEVQLASANDIFLEVTARKGHCLTNGHVVQQAKKWDTKLILNTDAHGPEDLITMEQAKKIALGAGLTQSDFDDMQANCRSFLSKLS